MLGCFCWNCSISDTRFPGMTVLTGSMIVELFNNKLVRARSRTDAFALFLNTCRKLSWLSQMQSSTLGPVTPYGYGGADYMSVFGFSSTFGCERDHIPPHGTHSAHFPVCLKVAYYKITQVGPDCGCVCFMYEV